MPQRKQDKVPVSVEGAFSRITLLGGPFDTLATRIKHRTGFGGTATFAIAASLMLWLILAVLVIIEGYSQKFFSLDVMAIHGRMLVAVPLIIWCAHLLDQAIRDACRELVTVGIVSANSTAELDREVSKLLRFSTSWRLQIGLLVVIVAFSASGLTKYIPGVSSFSGHPADASGSIARYWYTIVCLPAFRYVMARFIWLLGLWTVLIWKISRKPLDMIASHPDRAAGLGLFEVAQTQLLVFILAIAILDASALAEAANMTGLTNQQVYLQVMLIIVIGALLICGPLVLLTPKLFQCRRRALITFHALGHQYSVQFRNRWGASNSTGYLDFLGSSDIQSLADLAGSYENVRATRILPVTTSLLFMIAGCATAPHLPLLLLEYPIGELASDLVETLIGR